MKREILSAAFMAVAALAGSADAFGYEIHGKVATALTDVEGQYVYILPYGAKGADEAVDSAKISNGAFMLSGADKGDRMCRLFIKNKGIGKKYTTSFLLEKGSMEAVLDEFSYVKGTAENDAFAAVMQSRYNAEKQVDGLMPALRSGDADAMKKAEALEKEQTEAGKGYIEANTTKLTAAKLFFDMRYELDESEHEKILAAADANFKSFPGIDAMQEHLDVLKSVAPGKKFIDFEMADADGKMHKLSEYVGKGKVVLIDFWASWCGPCMREVPALVKIYNEYKEKGFEIVGISFDNKKANWMKAREDKGMTWTHLSDLKGWKSLAAPMYGVNSIPCTMLVDKDGTIIQRNLLGEGLEAKLKELLK